MRPTFLITLMLLVLCTGKVPAQQAKLKGWRDSVRSLLHTLAPVYTDSAQTQPEPVIAKKKREPHIGWPDGRVAELGTAYTLRKNEVRLNIFGPSSFAFSNRFEVKSYLLLLMAPNMSFKYRFLDHGSFAMAVEPGFAAGALPVAVAGGLAMPGGAFGAGTVGIVGFSDLYVKMYASWKPSHKFTFSLRSGISSINSRYYGIGGFAVIGRDGGAAGVLPINSALIRTNWLMMGFEADYVLNAHNAMVLRTSMGKLVNTHALDGAGSYTSRSFLAMPSLSWNRAWDHLHLTAGVYTVTDVPDFRILHRSKMPVAPFANVYWILNNGHTSRPH